MTDEIQRLQQEIEQLRQQLEYTDEFAAGVQVALLKVLPHLLRDHPKVETVRDQLRAASDRHEALRQNPECATPDDGSLASYEPSKTLYAVLAMLGVWPGVDPLETAREAIEPELD